MCAPGSITTPLLASLALLAALQPHAAVAEAPYQYPAPSGPGLGLGVNLPNNLPQQTPPAYINNGIVASNPNPGLGYVSPSLLVASPPPPVQGVNANPNYPLRYSNDYLEPDVHKHVYVHVAPEEPAERQAPLVVPARKPKKHYKIVFIKTPTVLPPAAAYVNLPQPDQEKTLIYVLSKKPDLQQSLVLSTPAPTQPAKPEVFFIRYKTNEAQQQQQLLYNNGGVGDAVKPLTNSYGVPLASPLGPASLQFPKGTTLATAAPSNVVNYNTV